MDSTPSSSVQRGGATRADGKQSLTCWQCGAEHAVAPLCPNCQAIAPLPADADHFVAMGIAPRLALGAAELEQRYYELSRLLHPDRHQQAAPVVRDASLANTAALTRAFRTLRDPISRGIYWLERNGEGLGRDNNRVPPELAALVFEVQEQIETYRGANGPARERQGEKLRVELGAIEQRQAGLLGDLQRLFERADSGAPATALLAEMKRVLSAHAYLNTLARDVTRALGDED